MGLIADTFKERSFGERVGYFTGRVMGRAFSNDLSASECMESLGRGNRAQFERSMPAAIGLGVKHGETHNHRPHALKPHEMVEADKPKQSIRAAFNRGKADGQKAKVESALRKKPALSTPRPSMA